MLEQIHFVSNVTFGGGERSLFGMASGVQNRAKFYLLRRTPSAPSMKNIVNKSCLKSKHSYNIFDQILNLIYAPLFVIFVLIFTSNRDSKISLVFHGFPFQFVLPMVSLVFRGSRGNIHFVYHQNKRLHSKINYIVGYFETLFLASSKAHIYAVSDFSRKQLEKYLENFGHTGTSIKIFRNTVIFSEPELNCSQYDKIKNQLKSRRLFIYPARFHKEKRHDRILKLSKQLSDRQNIVFVLLGDGPEFFSIQRQIEKGGLANIIMPGAISPSCMELFYKASEGVIFPSSNESFGLVFFESLHYKKPVFVWNNNLSDLKNVFDIKYFDDFVKGNLSIDIDDQYAQFVLSRHGPIASFNSIYSYFERESEL